MIAILKYIVKNILRTPVFSLILVLMLGAGSALFCVALGFEAQIINDIVEKERIEVGNSTIKMTFDSTSGSRIFTLNTLKSNEKFIADDFEYIIGGFNFTTAVQTGEKDVVVKVHSYKEDGKISDYGDYKAVNLFSDIELLESRIQPLYLDNDIIIPQSLAKALNVRLGDNINLLMSGGAKKMQVTAIAANTGLFAANNVLVDYGELVSTLQLPTFSTYNTALFKLKDENKAADYIGTIKSISQYQDKSVELSLDYDAIILKNNVSIKSKSTIIIMFIILIFMVIFFIAKTRVSSHNTAIKIMKEQGAGSLAVAGILVAEILLFGIIGWGLGISVLYVIGLSAIYAYGLIVMPVCAIVYLLHLTHPMLKNRLFKVAALALLIIAEIILAIFAFQTFIIALIPLLIMLSLLLSVILNKIFYRLIAKITDIRFPTAKKQNNLNAKKQDAADMRKSDTDGRQKQTVRAQKFGIITLLAQNSSDRTSAVYIVMSAVLLVFVLMYSSFTPLVDRLFTGSTDNYVLANVASGGNDIVKAIKEIDGVEVAAGCYLDLNANLKDEKGVGIIIISHEDFYHISDMLSFSGGQKQLREGKAVISKLLCEALNVDVGDTLSVKIGGADYQVEIGAVETSALSKFLLIESRNIAKNFYNNILLKINENKKSDAVSILRAKYGHQNALVVAKDEFLKDISSFERGMIDFIRMIIIIAAFFAIAALFSGFVLKVIRERSKEKIFSQQGASKPQILLQSFFVQILASIVPLFISVILAVSSLKLIIVYLNFFQINPIINFSFPIILITSIILYCTYLALFVISRLFAIFFKSRE